MPEGIKKVSKRAFNYHVQKEVNEILGRRAFVRSLVDDQIAITTWQSNVEYLLYLRQLDYTEWAGSRKFVNFASLDTNAIKRLIYKNGACFVYRNHLGQLDYAIPVPRSFTAMQEISEVTLTQYNANASSGKVYRVGIDGVLLVDTIGLNAGSLPPSQFKLIDWCLNLMADIFARLKINLVLSGDKIFVTVPDPAIAPVVEKQLNLAYDSNSPFVVLCDKMGEITHDIKPADAKFSELFGALKQYNIVRQSRYGSGNGAYGIDKVERLVTAEADTGSDDTRLVQCATQDLWDKQIIQLKLFPELSECDVIIGGDNGNNKSTNEMGTDTKWMGDQ